MAGAVSKTDTNIAPPILTRLASQGMSFSSSAAELVFQGFRDALTKRDDDILSAMRHVFKDAYIEDFVNLTEGLKAELIWRLESASTLASSEFQSSTASTRSQINHPNMPSEIALLQHLKSLQPKLLAEIDLICANLRDTQTPRLFLKKGDVFGGNRALRAIFESAQISVVIIDTYLGPKVFDLLEVTSGSVQIRPISDKPNKASAQAYRDFKQQNGRIEFRLCDSKDIHARYIIVDRQTALQIGHSLKDLGNSDSGIDPADTAEILKRFEELWRKARPVN